MVSMQSSVDVQARLIGQSDEEVASRLRVAVNRLQRRLRQEALGGLSPGQASTLGTVRRLGHPTLGELAAEEQVQPPSMTRIVGHLVAAGLVLREADEADRRSVRVRVTPEGERTLQRIRRAKNAFLVRRLDELGSEDRRRAEELVSLLEHLLGQP
jgi:DNA-binding MarR family transcriptional regulator